MNVGTLGMFTEGYASVKYSVPKALPLKPDLGYASQFRMRNKDSTPKPRRAVLVPFLIFLVLLFAGLYVMDNPRFATSLGSIGAPGAAAPPSSTPDAAVATVPAAAVSQQEPAPAPQPAPNASVPVALTPVDAASQPVSGADAIPLKFPKGLVSSAGAAAPASTGGPPAPSRGPSMMVPDAPQEKVAN